MAFKIFYAWQSDRPESLCKDLIRKALDAAAAELTQGFGIDIEIDQDTQDVPGSPSIPDTILEKIAASEAVVADLTLTHTSDKQINPAKRGSNPNVMLEYGYALRVGDRNIIGVINTAFGAVEELSFDLRHKRCITYCAAMGGDENERTKTRDDLAADLVSNIRPIIQGAVESEISGVTTRQFAWDEELSSPDPHGQRVELQRGPAIFLNLWPKKNEEQLVPPDAQDLAWAQLRPFSIPPNVVSSTNGWLTVRSQNGAGVLMVPDNDPSTVRSASMLTHNRSLHGIVFQFPGSNGDKPYVPIQLVEEILVDGLKHFLSLAKTDLNLEPPLRVEVGLEGVKYFALRVPNQQIGFGYDVIGQIPVTRIDYEFDIDSYGTYPVDVLLPFFKDVYHKAGHRRPENA